MCLIELVTERYSFGNQVTRQQIGLIEDRIKAKEYCDRKNKELEGTYNENLGCKYFQFRKLEILE